MQVQLNAKRFGHLKTKKKKKEEVEELEENTEEKLDVKRNNKKGA